MPPLPPAEGGVGFSDEAARSDCCQVRAGLDAVADGAGEGAGWRRGTGRPEEAKEERLLLLLDEELGRRGGERMLCCH